jgi:hypothetical protein
VVASDHVTVARKAMVSESSVIGGSNFSDGLFGCQLGPCSRPEFRYIQTDGSGDD